MTDANLKEAKISLAVICLFTPPFGWILLGAAIIWHWFN